MPPTRGHDLKLHLPEQKKWPGGDAPHTGARLETTRVPDTPLSKTEMPPTRGHDLKLKIPNGSKLLKKMPPTRGHDLKLTATIQEKPIGDAPHTGARLET